MVNLTLGFRLVKSVHDRILAFWDVYCVHLVVAEKAASDLVVSVSKFKENVLRLT